MRLAFPVIIRPVQTGVGNGILMMIGASRYEKVHWFAEGGCEAYKNVEAAVKLLLVSAVWLES